MNTKKIFLIFLTVIFISGFVTRVYKLTQVPPSLNWDEVAAAYNAYSIANWGKDEWGKKWPLVFTSFRDDKHPVHIYLTAPFIKILGPSDLAARLPAAFISSLGIIVIFFLARYLFKSDLAAIFSALFLAVSPYHHHYSRGLWEVDFALFFFLLGLTAFFAGLHRHRYFLYLFAFSFGMSLLSYHSSKIIVPPVFIFLTVLYFRQLKKLGRHFYISFLIFLVFLSLLIIEPRLLGLARVGQTGFSREQISQTYLYKKTQNNLLGMANITADNWLKYYDPQYLFEKGDQNPRGSVKVIGQFYKLDALLIIVGLLALLIMRSRVTLLVLLWLFLAPLPGALSTMHTNSTRAIFMLGGMQLLAALGAATLVRTAKFKYLKAFVVIVLLIFLSKETGNYLTYYFNQYPKKEAIEWQYGMKDIVEYVAANPQYDKVYMVKERQQPYIFFLYYLKTSPDYYLKTIKYDETQSKSFNNAESFGKYQFSAWDPVESVPDSHVLYIMTPYNYSGLRHINDFEVKRVVKYPDGSDAYFLVSGY